MVRSMYSGVSGLSTHQTRMDTIGNNIANVNTYGFKSSRTTFRDIYYQNISSSSAPTGGQGGTNPSQVGYGSQVGSVDLQMTRSTFSMTGQTMDLAIDGDGFLQVMDAAGNIYYTRAGMLNFDAAGNLVDTQGNYVLGVNGDPTGKAAGSERITVSLANVPPTAASVEETINGVPMTLSASNTTKDGNINFNFSSDATLTDGVKANATISSTGIVITFNANEHFNNVGEINAAVNDAIREANGGQNHVAGEFTLAFSDPTINPFAELPANQNPPTGTKGFLTGEELASTDYNVQYGSTVFTPTTAYFGGITPSGKVGSEFGKDFTGTPPAVGGTGTAGYNATYSAGPPAAWNISMVVGGITYTGTIDDTRTTSGKFNLTNPANPTNDYIEMSRPSFDDITAAWQSDTGVAAGTMPTDGVDFAAAYTGGAGYADLTGTATASSPSYALGLSSKALTLRDGTEGGPQGLADMTGIAISGNGVIVGLDSQGTEVYIGRIDLATFANQAGLTQSGSTSYIVSQNSGAPTLGQPGEGGAGQLISGTLELSNVDLSREFSDMITTQRGYQANSRIITVSDTMLEELINLKR